MSHAPPPGPPPRRQNSLDVAIPDEAPPAYESISGDATVASGPSRMDFSGPPPLPDRLRPTPSGGQSIPGVGVGYGAPSNQGGYAPPPRPPPPPRHPNTYSSPSSPGGADTSPTEAPVPGRPLLHHGKLLVYPKNYICSKCQNTGYKGGNPQHPCSSDWRKYGKEYSGALAASFAIRPNAAHEPSIAAQNFQRPLPAQHPPQQYQQQPYQPRYQTPHQHQAGMGGYPGQYRPPPPPIHHTMAPPQGALVVQPGDPRIGGSLCYRCGGSGRETSIFLFDDGPCYQCRGVGRVF